MQLMISLCTLKPFLSGVTQNGTTREEVREARMLRVRGFRYNCSSSSHPMLKLASIKYKHARILSSPSVRPRFWSTFITEKIDYGSTCPDSRRSPRRCRPSFSPMVCCDAFPRPASTIDPFAMRSKIRTHPQQCKLRRSSTFIGSYWPHQSPASAYPLPNPHHPAAAALVLPCAVSSRPLRIRRLKCPGPAGRAKKSTPWPLGYSQLSILDCVEEGCQCAHILYRPLHCQGHPQGDWAGLV